MRRLLCLLALAATAVAAVAQTTLDFASKFMQLCTEDTAVHCVTISPKMMEQLTKHPGAARDGAMAEAIEKLKSARIVTASVRGDDYYRRADILLKDYPQRFSHAQDYLNAHSRGTFYVRRTSSGDTVELVMLHTDTKAGSLVIVNLTGDIDADFVRSLMESFAGRTAKRASKRHFYAFSYNNHV